VTAPGQPRGLSVGSYHWVSLSCNGTWAGTPGHGGRAPPPPPPPRLGPQPWWELVVSGGGDPEERPGVLLAHVRGRGELGHQLGEDPLDVLDRAITAIVTVVRDRMDRSKGAA
jgi:hypothetical protein